MESSDKDPMVEAIEKDNVKPAAWRRITGRIWFSFLIALLAEIVAGTLYNYAAWSGDLKDNFEFSQGDTDLVGSLGNIGQYMGPIAGIVFDIAGTRYACLIAAVLNWLGYFLLFLVSKTTIGATSAGIQGFFLMISGLGSQILYLTALSTNVKVFPEEYRGLVIGTLVSTYGLCATVFTAFSTRYWSDGTAQQNLEGFQLFMSVTTGAVSIIAAFGLYQVGSHMSDQRRESLSEKLIGTTEKARTAVNRVINALVEKVVSLTFWMIWIAFFLGVGAGLLHINNFAQLIQSLNKEIDQADKNVVFICITLQSVFNAVGRFSMGISDYVPIRRGWWMVLALLLMALGQLLAALIFKDGNFSNVYGVTVLIGFSYGMIWSITPTMVSEIWGTKNFAQNWGWVLLAAAATTYAYNGLAGKIYDGQVSHHPAPADLDAPHDCIGHTCFRNAYFIGAGLCVLGAAVALLLTPRTAYGKKPVEDDDVAGDEVEDGLMGAPSKKSSVIAMQSATRDV